jgi:hypothetical protein
MHFYTFLLVNASMVPKFSDGTYSEKNQSIVNGLDGLNQVCGCEEQKPFG